MKKLLIALTTLGLAGGALTVAPAVASADRVVVTHYRDHHYRPAQRFERHEFRRGYRWHAGEWRWNGGEWVWAPGWYIVIR